MLDALQVFSVALLRHVLLELDWRGRRFKTIDHVVRQEQVAGRRRGDFIEWRNSSLQAVYVPLRELCRKFDGLGDKLSVSPPLVLPPQANALPRDAPRNKTRLLATMLCRSDECVSTLLAAREPLATAATVSPVAAWRHAMLSLYARPPTPDGAACVPPMTSGRWAGSW